LLIITTRKHDNNLLEVVKLEKKWKTLLESARENYITTMKALAEQQKEVLTVIMSLTEKQKNLREENIKKTIDLVNTFKEKRETLANMLREKVYESLSIIPGIEDSIFNRRFKEMAKMVNKYIEDFFSLFKKN